MKIAIRLDDISIDMNWEKFYRFKELLDEYEIKPLIGVIPDNKDQMLKDFREESKVSFEGDFWAYIRELKDSGWCVAMHGLNHVYTTTKGGLFPLNKFSEFSGLSYEEQYEMLSYGKEILLSNGIETDIFMAPAHNYDGNTLKALKELGFSKVTDGFGSRPYEYKGINFYPISFQRSKVIDKSSIGKSSIGKLTTGNKQDNSSKNSEHVNSDEYSTLVFHTNTMKDKDFQGAKEIFGKIESCSFKEYLDLNASKRGFLGHSKEYVMARVKNVLTRK